MRKKLRRIKVGPIIYEIFPRFETLDSVFLVNELLISFNGGLRVWEAEAGVIFTKKLINNLRKNSKDFGF